jgi:hypothetical protein
MTSRILTAAIFLLVMGALIYQRFDLPEQLLVSVTQVQGESTYDVGDTIPRGTLLTTEDDFLSVTIGPDRILKLAPRTTVELKSLSLEQVVLDLTRGRMLFLSEATTPTIIDTNHTQHQMNTGSVTMVNFDFLESVHVIPLSAELESILLLADEILATADPISIHETEPVFWEYIAPDLSAGDAADFYRWAGLLAE